jgi:Flp pilus assembly protein protease CpaA
MSSSAIAVLALVRMMVAGDAIAATHTIEASGTVLVVGFLPFWREVVGSGDAKLLTAMALLVGSRDLLGFLFVTSICGGALALMILAARQAPSMLLASLATGRHGVRGVGRRMRRNLDAINCSLRGWQ